MPLTPLHFGVLAPVNYFLPGKVSLISFGLVNAWIDHRFIEAALTGQPLPAHDQIHNLVGVLIVGTLVAMPGVRSAKWVIGAYFAALTHLLLDGLVHPDIQPFHWVEGNVLYMGLMEPLSLTLLPFMIWLIFQVVRSLIDWTKGAWKSLCSVFR
jgi:hypothetical protein